MIQFSHELSQVKGYSPQQAKAMVESVMDEVIKRQQDAAWVEVADAIHRKATKTIKLMQVLKAPKPMKALKALKAKRRR